MGMEYILLNFERSKELKYIVNYVVNNEMRVKEFPTMKSATTFAKRCKDFRRLGARGGYDGLYHICEARDLDSVYNFAHRERNNGKKKS